MKKRKKHSAAEIIKKLREAEIAEAQGAVVADIVRKLAVSEQTDYRWKKKFGGMTAPDARRLKDLEKENARLKKLVADLTLEVDLLKEVARGKF